MPAAIREPMGSAAVAAASRTVETPESAASTQLPWQSALIVEEPLSRMPAPERMLRSGGDAAKLGLIDAPPPPLPPPPFPLGVGTIVGTVGRRTNAAMSSSAS